MATPQAKTRQMFVDWNTAILSKQPAPAYAIADVIRRGYEADPGTMFITGTLDGFAFEWKGGEIAMATPDCFQMILDMEDRGIDFPWDMTSIHGHDSRGTPCVFLTRIDGDGLEEQWGLPPAIVD